MFIPRIQIFILEGSRIHSNKRGGGKICRLTFFVATNLAKFLTILFLTGTEKIWANWQNREERGVAAYRCRWYRWQFATGVVDTGGKFATGIIDTGGKFATGINNTSKTGGKFATGVADTDGQPWAANISADFRKNSKRP